MKLTPLIAGPLSMMFDPSNAFLRYVRVGEAELIRGVFVAVRDRNWDTVPFSINEVRVQQSVSDFSVSFVAKSLRTEIDFTWLGWIEGSSRGAVEYRFRGTAQSPFYRNRIGLCVLHPSGACAGKPCRVEHIDGSSTNSEFPVLISPHQPFKHLRSISHSVEPNLHVNVTMTGDIFETEDQRNWTDASYKTYSTPLDIPFPVLVEPGTTMEQSVTIELNGAECHRLPACGPQITGWRSMPPPDPNPYRIEIDWNQPIRRPQVGFQWPSSMQSRPDGAVTDRLAALRPDHLRFDIWLTEESWRTDLLRASDIAKSIDTKMEIALFFDSVSGADWQECLQTLSQLQFQISRVLVFHSVAKSTPSTLFEPAIDALKLVAPNVQIAVGTNVYFAELNRDRPLLAPGCQVCYSINPQVHAFDNLSLAETLEAQRATVDSAASVFGTDVVISPVTLKPRFNPNATSSIATDVQLRSAVDPRQITGFGAAWTAGVFASLLTHHGVSSITLYEAIGPRGIMGIKGLQFPMTKPIEHVLRCEQLFCSHSPFQREVVALGTQDRDGKKHIVIGNLCDSDVSVGFTAPNKREQSVVVAAESVRIVFMREAVDA